MRTDNHTSMKAITLYSGLVVHKDYTTIAIAEFGLKVKSASVIRPSTQKGQSESARRASLPERAVARLSTRQGGEAGGGGAWDGSLGSLKGCRIFWPR
jgi:hypothetical protein